MAVHINPRVLAEALRGILPLDEVIEAYTYAVYVANHRNWSRAAVQLGCDRARVKRIVKKREQRQRRPDPDVQHAPDMDGGR